MGLSSRHIRKSGMMPTLQEKNGIYERPFDVVSAFLWDRYVVINLHLRAVCKMIPVCHVVRAGVEVCAPM